MRGSVDRVKKHLLAYFCVLNLTNFLKALFLC